MRCYYLTKEEADAQDIWFASKKVNSNQRQLVTVEVRYGLPNQEYYFKSQDEMKSLFRDLPKP